MRVSLIAVLLLSTGCATMGVVVQGDPSYDEKPGHTATLGIPPGHLPPPGSCRVWLPGHPPGHQPPPGSCSRLEGEVPPGAWLLYHPTNRPEEIRVSVYDDQRPGILVVFRFYTVETGRFLRREEP